VTILENAVDESITKILEIPQGYIEKSRQIRLSKVRKEQEGIIQ
jgi:hypothetical protein